MSLASHVISSSLSLSKTDVQNVLLILYKLVKLSKSSLRYMQYNYNYNYIPPLAMTGALPLPVIKIQVPIQELPNLKWVLSVAQKITLILVNDALIKLANSSDFHVSYGVNGDTKTNNLVIDYKVKALEDLQQKIQAAQSCQDLEKVALNLASLTQEITEEIVGYNAFSIVSYNSPTISDFQETIKSIDEEFELHEFHKEPGNIEFLAPFNLEDSITDLLNSAFKKILDSDIKLLELNNIEVSSSDLGFSSNESASNRSLEDYNKLFMKIPLPEISSRFKEDLVFGYMQVAGPNPMMLQQVLQQEEILQISNQQYQEILGIGNDSLEAARREGRLYKADYSKLKNMENGSFPNQQSIFIRL